MHRDNDLHILGRTGLRLPKHRSSHPASAFVAESAQCHAPFVTRSLPANHAIKLVPIRLGICPMTRGFVLFVRGVVAWEFQAEVARRRSKAVHEALPQIVIGRGLEAIL